MDKLIDRLRGYINHWEARNFDMDRISPHSQTIPISGNQAKDYLRLLEQEQEIKQQCMNAFAAGIMRSDEDVTGKTLPELFDEFWKLNAPELI